METTSTTTLADTSCEMSSLKEDIQSMFERDSEDDMGIQSLFESKDPANMITPK